MARWQIVSMIGLIPADEAIVRWWDTEEAMFRQLEGALIVEKLEVGFEDADDFLAFSQSIRQ